MSRRGAAPSEFNDNAGLPLFDFYEVVGSAAAVQQRHDEVRIMLSVASVADRFDVIVVLLWRGTFIFLDDLGSDLGLADRWGA